MRMGCKLSSQSHFTCLVHDHAKCSCIGGPRRLVQSHFTCHSHEWSSSLFFVTHVHRTYTSIRVSCIQHRLFCVCIVSRSSVSVVLQFLFLLPRVPVKMFCHARKHFISLTQVARVSRFRVPTTFGFHTTNIRNMPTVISAY